GRAVVVLVLVNQAPLLARGLVLFLVLVAGGPLLARGLVLVVVAGRSLLAGRLGDRLLVVVIAGGPLLARGLVLLLVRGRRARAALGRRRGHGPRRRGRDREHFLAAGAAPLLAGVLVGDADVLLAVRALELDHEESRSLMDDR